MPVHISNVLEGYLHSQQRVYDCLRTWHDFPTPENLTAYVNAQEDLLSRAEQPPLPFHVEQPEQVYGLW